MSLKSTLKKFAMFRKAFHKVLAISREFSKSAEHVLTEFKAPFIQLLLFYFEIRDGRTLHDEAEQDNLTTKVLIVRNKYRNRKKKYGTSHADDYLAKSIQNVNFGEVLEYSYENHSGFFFGHERNIRKLIKKKNPKMIILSSYNCSKIGYPHHNFFTYLREKFDTPVVRIWWDSTGRDYVEQVRKMGSDITLNVLIESDILQKRAQKYSRFLRLWAPIDHHNFYPTEVERDILVSFVGSIGSYRSDRLSFINFLTGHDIPIFIGGYDTPNLVSETDFEDILARSKMSLNFSQSVENNHQLKGRVFEIIFSGSLLLESKNSETSQYFEPGTHYVEFTSKQDLLDKINYYKKNPDERNKIANAGRAHALRNYSQEKFWRSLCKAINVDMNIEE